MFKFFKKAKAVLNLNLPSYEIVTTWEHGDADEYTKTSTTFDREEDFLEYLKFFCELEDRSHDACNDEGVYPNIVKECFGSGAEESEYLEPDIHFSNSYARVDRVRVKLGGVPHDYVNLEEVKQISLPEVGSTVTRNFGNTIKEDRTRWYSIPDNVDFWQYQRENHRNFTVRVSHISVEAINLKRVTYRVHGVVIDTEYEGTLCSWKVQGYDPNFK